MAKRRRSRTRSDKALGKLVYYFFMLCVWIIILPIMIVIKLYKSGKISKKAAVIIGIALGTTWLLVVGGSAGASSVDNVKKQPESRNVTETTATETPVVEVSAVSLNAEKSEIILGETMKLEGVVLPRNANDQSLTYSSSDESILSVSTDGVICGVSGGTAIITATSRNGLCSSVTLNVDASKTIDKLVVRSHRTNDVNIGNEWSYSYEINGERVTSGDYTLSVGDSLTFKAIIIESDDNPDVGSNSKTHIITEDDLINGFSESFEVYVTENGGRNSGQSAIYHVTFEFSRK